MKMPIGLFIVGLIIVIGVIFMGYTYAAVDYEAGNRTGNMTETTNQTMTSYEIQYAWWWGVVILISLLTIMAVFRLFVK